MQWWNDFVTWFYSEEGWRVISTVILPFLAILLAGIFAALLARGTVKRLLAEQLRAQKAAAIAALIGAGRKAVTWSSLGADEKQHVDSLISEAEIRVRLLPVNGVSAAADWAAHELASMKRNSASFTFQAEQTFVDYRDRLLEWQDKPKRARKLFAHDLEQWRFEGVDKALDEKERQWSAGNVVETDSYEDDYDDLPSTAAVPLPDASRDLAPTPPMPQSLRTALMPEAADPWAPPVNAGTVRQRIAPDPHDKL